jgi:hypothetical protein
MLFKRDISYDFVCSILPLVMGTLVVLAGTLAIGALAQ